MIKYFSSSHMDAHSSLHLSIEPHPKRMNTLNIALFRGSTFQYRSKFRSFNKISSQKFYYHISIFKAWIIESWHLLSTHGFFIWLARNLYMRWAYHLWLTSDDDCLYKNKLKWRSVQHQQIILYYQKHGFIMNKVY